MPESPVLITKNVRISFTKKDEKPFIAVQQLSFQLNIGKTLAIVGESGSGKSLTALAIMGLLPQNAIQEGAIFLNSQNKNIALHECASLQQWQSLRGKDMAMIFQEPMTSLNPTRSVGKQIEEAIITHQPISRKQARQQTLAWMEKVKIPQPDISYHKYPHQLSGGQKQRIMIAIAMCNHPKLLIADEPTTALDVTVQQEIITLMQSLQKELGTALIFITHDLQLAADIANEVLVMQEGGVVETGKTLEVFRHPKHIYTKALLSCRPTKEKKGKPLQTIDDLLSNQINVINYEKKSILPYTEHHLLDVRQLKVSFVQATNWLGKPLDYFDAVDDVNFHIRQGEVVGLVGESGCGKTTISKCIMGLIPIKEGSIFYKEKDISKASSKERKSLARHIQMIFQDPYASLNPRMKVADLIAEPIHTHKIISQNKIHQHVKKLLSLVHLPEAALHKYPHEFSGGQRQRIGIARALALQPQLLICDESVSALDLSIQAQILNLLKEIQHELHLSYLFISHDLSVVHYISDRVLVMQSGKIVEEGMAADLMEHPRHPYTQKLLASVPQGG